MKSYDSRLNKYAWRKFENKKSENWFFPTGFSLFFRALSTVNDLNMNRNIRLWLKNMCRKIMTFSQNSTSALRLNKTKKSLWSFREKQRQHELAFWLAWDDLLKQNRFRAIEGEKNCSKAFPIALTGISECLMRTEKGTKNKSSE